MQKSGDAVIRMHQNLDKISYLVGNENVLENISNVPSLPIFSDNVIEFLSLLSFEILHNPKAKQFSDVISYAFWIRKSEITKIKNDYDDDKMRIGKGLTFHITPSNIPVQFVISMTYALIAGNAVLVRISNKIFDQVDIICGIINRILIEKTPNLLNYICIIRYEHDDKITEILSKKSDIRMIWGGDETINRIKSIPCAPRCLDLGFADRFSIAIIDAEAYLDEDMAIIANRFYTDTYYTDQNACSSPRLVVWLGKNVSAAKERFWNELNRLAADKYDMSVISSSDKLLNTAVLAAKYPEIKQVKNDNYCVRIELPELFNDIMQYKGNSGFFFEYTANTLEDIIPILSKECQTITYIGDIYNALKRIILKNGIRGVDRIVPVGKSLELGFVWDGLDLPIVLSRVVGNI